jgi:hypothetical protein
VVGVINYVIRPFLLLILSLFFIFPVFGQVQPPSVYQPQLVSFHGAPFNNCTADQVALNNTNGVFYSCNPTTNTWLVASGSSSVAWNNILAATASAIIANNGFNTTFNHTSAVTWSWNNTTAAIHLTPQNSPIFSWGARYFNGSVDSADSWTSQVVIGSADNGTSTLTFLHSGSSGVSAVQLPAANILGVQQDKFGLDNQGAAQTSGNISISAGWGTGAAVSVVSGFSERSQWTITAGTSPSSSPTITITFPDAFPGTPICFSVQNGGTGAISDISVSTLPNTTTIGLTWNGLPVNTSTYVIVLDCR